MYTTSKRQDTTVLKVWKLGKVVDTNYSRDRDNQKLLKIIVSIHPVVARAPSGDPESPGLVPVDADKIMNVMALKTNINDRVQVYKQRNEQTKQQEQCKSSISSKSFAALRLSPGLTTEQVAEIQNLKSQLDALRQIKNQEIVR